MITLRNWAILAAAISCAAVAASQARTLRAAPRAPASKTERARIVFSHAMPKLDGAHLNATIVEVAYGPGEFSLPHSHPCPVIVYVLEGAVRTQVKGESEAVYKAGESFYEAPNGVHQVSANASQKDPAKFIAYFLCDHQTPLSIPVSESKSAGGK